MGGEMKSLFAALRSVPDYTAGAPTFVGVYRTLDGAIHALYPDNAAHREAFREVKSAQEWEGPDGFGLVRRVGVGE